MATAAWPSWARLRATDYELTSAPTVARTEFDDGAVRQVRRTLRPVTHRTVVAEIPGDRLVEFRTWAEQHAYTAFTARDLDGSTRLMRVVGGVGGITYRQAARRAGRAWWDASLTLEDAPVASLAFPVASLVHLARPLDLPWALPAAYGGVPPYRYQLTPALPAHLALDRAARRVMLAETPVNPLYNTIENERFPIYPIVSAWTAEDAIGAEVSIPVTLTMQGYPMTDAVANASGELVFSPDPSRILRPSMFSSQGLIDSNRRINRIGLSRAAGTVTLRIGPGRTSQDLLPAVARDLRLRFSATVTGAEHTVTVVGPAATTVAHPDQTDPYAWVPPNAAEVTAFVDAVPGGTQVTVDYWLAAPP